jgi:hypothetical protein
MEWSRRPLCAEEAVCLDPSLPYRAAAFLAESEPTISSHVDWGAAEIRRPSSAARAWLGLAVAVSSSCLLAALAYALALASL